jgi:formylglycine-generating enzyme required for sulfatase activity
MAPETRSLAELALLATFASPRPKDNGPYKQNWDQYLGEDAEAVVARFESEELIRLCDNVEETLAHGVKMLSSERLAFILKQHGIELPEVPNVKDLLAGADKLVVSGENILYLYYEVPDVWVLSKAGELQIADIERRLEQGAAAPDGERKQPEVTSKKEKKVSEEQILKLLRGFLKGIPWFLAGELSGKLLEDFALDPILHGYVYPEAEKLLAALKTLAPDSEMPLPMPVPKPKLPKEEESPKPIVQEKPEHGTGRYIEPAMVRVSAGNFWMGSRDNDEDAYFAEKRQHRLHLPAYWIGRYPVTNREYRCFVVDAGQKPPSSWEGREYPAGKVDHPVVNVTWHDALAYCQWLAGLTGEAYTLPSEAEWEKAARGPDANIYPWGNQWDSSLCNSAESGIGTTTSVGRYSPRGDSYYKCADMAGNVWEWTRSLYKDYPYKSSDGRESLSGSGPRVLRGGSFDYNRRYARCASRFRNFPDLWSLNDAFRVVVSPGKP